MIANLSPVTPASRRVKTKLPRAQPVIASIGSGTNIQVHLSGAPAPVDSATLPRASDDRLVVENIDNDWREAPTAPACSRAGEPKKPGLRDLALESDDRLLMTRSAR